MLNGFWSLYSIEWVQEDPTEVAQFGQTQALINAIISEVLFILYFNTPTFS